MQHVNYEKYYSLNWTPEDQNPTKVRLWDLNFVHSADITKLVVITAGGQGAPTSGTVNLLSRVPEADEDYRLYCVIPSVTLTSSYGQMFSDHGYAFRNMTGTNATYTVPKIYLRLEFSSAPTTPMVISVAIGFRSQF